jgi:hypothetical protein
MAQEASSIRVLASEFGWYPEIFPLNPEFRPGASAVKLTVEIDWPSADAIAALAALEAQLVAFSPSFRFHQCRGPHQYRVFVDPGNSARGAAAEALEASLALAHLLEHVMIDSIAFVTDALSVSGITGAHADSRDTFDIFVECSEPVVAKLASDLGRSWMETLMVGGRLDRSPRATLELARFLYRNRTRVVDPGLVARSLGIAQGTARQALARLEAAGFACPEPQTMNLSGLSHYRLCKAPAEGAPSLEAH